MLLLAAAAAQSHQPLSFLLIPSPLHLLPPACPGPPRPRPARPLQIYSRNSEDNTSKYPDIAALVPRQLRPGVRSVVLDAEAVAYDQAAGKILPFQVSAGGGGGGGMLLLLGGYEGGGGMQACLLRWNLSIDDRPPTPNTHLHTHPHRTHPPHLCPPPVPPTCPSDPVNPGPQGRVGGIHQGQRLRLRL